MKWIALIAFLCFSTTGPRVRGIQIEGDISVYAKKTIEDLYLLEDELIQPIKRIVFQPLHEETQASAKTDGTILISSLNYSPLRLRHEAYHLFNRYACLPNRCTDSEEFETGWEEEKENLKLPPYFLQNEEEIFAGLCLENWMDPQSFQNQAPKLSAWLNHLFQQKRAKGDQ
ncbi:hypothetical protein [Ileibacterium valens]|uniref:hypothetical protein n=1 Tax=Ileibacterium valens TaxID=1862668 RepID=UPI0025734A26|nr:hypothetical protein [Ileibacterium valens]